MLATRATPLSRCLLFSGLFRSIVCVSSATSSSPFSTVSSWSALTIGHDKKAAIGSTLSSRLLCSLSGDPPSDESDTMSSSIAQGTPEVVKARGQQKGTLIFLHGLGDQGHGWADAFKSEVRADHLKVICPHSADRPVTLNMGMRMPAWYDLYGLDATAREDEQGIVAASQYVHSLIDAEVAAGIPANKIAVGGFSMGGALAIYAGLTYPQKLGGIVGLSSFFLQRNKFPGSYTANNQTPIFLGHGTSDFLVPLQIGQLSETLIKKFNPHVSMHTYPGVGHSSCSQEMQDLKHFLNTNIA